MPLSIKSNKRTILGLFLTTPNSVYSNILRSAARKLPQSPRTRRQFLCKCVSPCQFFCGSARIGSYFREHNCNTDHKRFYLGLWGKKGPIHFREWFRVDLPLPFILHFHYLILLEMNEVNSPGVFKNNQYNCLLTNLVITFVCYFQDNIDRRA